MRVEFRQKDRVWRNKVLVTRCLLLMIVAPDSAFGVLPLSKAGRLKWSKTSSGNSPGLIPSRLSVIRSLSLPSDQPCGMDLESLSEKAEGKSAAVAGSRPVGLRPSSLARTGSKSTNQLWKSARAIASSVAFIRRFNSILSSSAPSTAAMAFCSARGGSLALCARMRPGEVCLTVVPVALANTS